MRYGGVLEPQGDDGQAAQVQRNVLVFPCVSNKRRQTRGPQKVDWHKCELGESVFYPFMHISCPPPSHFGWPRPFCCWKKDMKPGMQPVFRALDIPFVLCATASLQDFGHLVWKTLSGVPWGRCGLWVWRMRWKKWTCWISCSDYFSRLILISCDDSVAEEARLCHFSSLPSCGEQLFCCVCLLPLHRHMVVV